MSADNTKVITNELSALLERTNEDAFVIFEAEPSEKFVQFAGSKDHPLLLDLPAQALSEEEFTRAESYFQAQGHEVEEYDLIDGPEGNPSGRQVSFQMLLGDDVGRATEITLDVFAQIYELPADFSLRIERN